MHTDAEYFITTNKTKNFYADRFWRYEDKYELNVMHTKKGEFLQKKVGILRMWKLPK